MKINHTMCISKILTDLCAIKQKIQIKNIFVNATKNKNKNYLCKC